METLNNTRKSELSLKERHVQDRKTNVVTASALVAEEFVGRLRTAEVRSG